MFSTKALVGYSISGSYLEGGLAKATTNEMGALKHACLNLAFERYLRLEIAILGR